MITMNTSTMLHNNSTDLFSMGTTTSPPSSTPSPVFLYLIQAYCILVMIAGVFGNVCVLIVFLSKWNSLRTYELFFISLAVADLIGTLVYPSYKVLDMRGIWFQVEGCRTVFFLNHVSITVSSLTLTSVSIDRYIAIKWIEWSSADRKPLCKVLLAITWFMGAAFGLVFLLGDAMLVENGKCRMNKTSTLEIVWSTVATYSLQNFIPIIVMILLYSLIIYELYKTSKDCRPYLTPLNFRFRRLRNRRTTKLLVIVVAVFFLCVTPKSLFYIFYINDMFGMNRNEPSQLIHIINSAFTLLKMTNACVNPIIYSKLHTSFRKRMASFIESRFRVSKLYKRRASTLALYQNSLIDHRCTCQVSTKAGVEK